MTLRERCEEMLSLFRQNGILRQSDRDIDAMIAFVVAEKGRAADPALEETLPLCLYFKNEQDREDFIAAVHEAKPNMIARTWP